MGKYADEFERRAKEIVRRETEKFRAAVACKRRVPIPIDGHEGVKLVGEWGTYPRDFWQVELDALWWRYGDTVVWFMDMPEPWGDCLQVHACSRRGSGPVGTEEAMEALELVARESGAKRVYAVLPEDWSWLSREVVARGRGARTVASAWQMPARHHKLMRRYLRIRGWESDDIGMYLELGEAA